MFTICIFTKLGHVRRALKQTPGQRILPRQDCAPLFWNSWIRHWSHCKWVVIPKVTTHTYRETTFLLLSIHKTCRQWTGIMIVYCLNTVSFITHVLNLKTHSVYTCKYIHTQFVYTCMKYKNIYKYIQSADINTVRWFTSKSNTHSLLNVSEGT